MAAGSDDDKFQFVFDKADALIAVADIGRRLDLGRAFGYPDSWRVAFAYAPGRMIELGWWYDEVTEYWFPQWWPGWAQ